MVRIMSKKKIFLVKTIVVLGMIGSGSAYFLFNYMEKSRCSNVLLNEALEVKNYSKIRSCANLNIPRAMGILGKLYMQGMGVNRDDKEAMIWSKKAADRFDSLGMETIATLYHNGIGVELDYNKAIIWNQKAIEHGSIDAMVNISIAYANNSLFNNKPEDKGLSIEWLKKASDSGSAEGMCKLAGYYRSKNKYIPQDYEKAIDLLTKASDQKHVCGFLGMADMYLYGNGAKQSYEKAFFWYQKAVDQGSEIAMRYILPNPTPFDLEITKATVEDFKKHFPNYKKTSISYEFNPYKNGQTFFVNAKYTGMDQVKDDVVFVFNDNQILEGVLIFFPQNEYDKIKDLLAEKYNGKKNETFYLIGFTQINIHPYFDLFGLDIYDDRPSPSFITVRYQSIVFRDLLNQYRDDKREAKKITKKRPLSTTKIFLHPLEKVLTKS